MTEAIASSKSAMPSRTRPRDTSTSPWSWIAIATRSRLPNRRPIRVASSASVIDPSRSPWKRATLAWISARKPCSTDSGRSPRWRCAFMSQPIATAGSPRSKCSTARRPAMNAGPRIVPFGRVSRVGLLPRRDRLVELREPPGRVGETLEVCRSEEGRLDVSKHRVGVGPRLSSDGVAGPLDAVDAVGHAQPARLLGGSTARWAYASARRRTTCARSSSSRPGTSLAILCASTSRALAAAAAAFISESCAVICEITPGGDATPAEGSSRVLSEPTPDRSDAGASPRSACEPE